MLSKVLSILLTIIICFSSSISADFCQDAKPCAENNCYWLYEWSSYLCDCSNGKFSLNKTCIEQVSVCASNPCINGGSCSIQSNNKYRCNCPAEFSGNNCEVRLITPDVCTSLKPCANGGKCISLPNNFACECSSQFTGLRCETTIVNRCNSSVCSNGGVCVDRNGLVSCECQAGWGGQICNQTLIGTCTSNPNICRNGGTCRDVYNGIFPVSYACTCTSQYNGLNCESLVNACQSASCNNGLCFNNQNGGFSCRCFPGWSGEVCNIKLVCDQSNPCLNGGTCINNGTSCMCPQFFTGQHCEKIDGPICAVNICSNGGTCYQLLTRLYCACAGKYNGQYCELV